MPALVGRWAIVPTWLFFVVLGNSSRGGAVSPPLLPAPFAFVSQWLPSGATVTSLRNAIYFPDYQHARPIPSWRPGPRSSARCGRLLSPRDQPRRPLRAADLIEMAAAG